MTIDLRGANTNNKGAELMLIAAATRLGARAPVSATPAGTAYAARARLGLYQTLHVHQSPVLFSRAGNHVPQRLRRSYGLISDAEISGIVDISGFAYGDQFAATRAVREARRARDWDARDLPRVFLPQAFGPFTNTELSMASRAVLVGAEVVFCGDQESLDHVRRLDPSINARLAPDFTIGVRAASAERYDLPADFAALVPNTKLITSGTASEAAYRQGLVQAGRAAQALGLAVLIVRQETLDGAFCDRLAQDLGCEVIRDADPLVTKGVLKAARLVIGSRLHAIVSALAQDVPCVAMGWSHKFEGAVRDFGVRSWLVNDPQALAPAVATVLGDRAGQASLQARTAELSEQVEDMWRQTFEALRI